MTKKINPPLEKDIQRAVLDYLNLRGIFHWRANTMGVPLKDGGWRPGPTTGVADVLALFKGRFYAIEVKRPGSKTSPAQDTFLANVNKNGGIAVVVHNVEEVISLFS